MDIGAALDASRRVRFAEAKSKKRSRPSPTACSPNAALPPISIKMRASARRLAWRHINMFEEIERVFDNQTDDDRRARIIEYSTRASRAVPNAA